MPIGKQFAGRTMLFMRFKLLRRLFDWCALHQKTVYVCCGISYFLIKAADWIGGWLGRGEIGMTVAGWLLSVFAILGPWVLLGFAAIVMIYAHWPAIEARFRGPSFAIRPIHGQSFALVAGDFDVIARLAITNTSGMPLKRCTVRLLGSSFVERGHVVGNHCVWPGINSFRGDTFYLRWSRQEYPDANGLYLEIPSDSTERFADCLILDRSNPAGLARFAVVNQQDLQNRTVGVGGKRWWKLHVRVSSESGHSTDALLVAACSDRDPGPITLDYWHPRGEQIIAAQLKEIAKKQTSVGSDESANSSGQGVSL